MSQDSGYGAGREDVNEAMRRALRTSRPSRRTNPVPTQRPDNPFRPRRFQAATAPADRNTVTAAGGGPPVIPVIIIGIGMYLTWFGVHYWRSDTRWPTDPIKAVLQGKSAPQPTVTPTVDEAAVLAAAQQLAGQQGTTPGTGTTPPASSAVGQAVVSGAAPNQGTGKLLAAAYGWSSGSQWDALVQLWDAESGWDNTVWNGGSHAATQPAGSSGAYGIAQALPYTKYPKPAQPPGYGGQADPTSQITWGLAYIKATYGTPAAAEAHEKANGWY